MQFMKKSSLWLWLVVGLIPCLTGCGTFHREWKAAAKSDGPRQGVMGSWDGEWRSQVNGHNGRLRCLVRPGEDGRPVAWFRANYMRILSFESSVTLDVVPSVDGQEFSGEADLGKMAGGLYHYKGLANGTNFFSTYQCERDHGVFEMRRVPAPSSKR